MEVGDWMEDLLLTADRQQSKTLLTIHEQRSKIDRNGV